MTPLDKPSRGVARVTIGELGHAHGIDKRRRLVARLAYGDLLELRPHGTRRPQTVALVDVYTWALKCQANRKQLEKARARAAELGAKKAAAAWRRKIKRGKL